MSTPVLQAAGIDFAYEADAPVLRGVSLELHAGECLGVIGPNGAGKSTLLRALLGFLRPQSGSVRLLGDEVAALPRRVVAQRAAFLPQGAQAAFSFPVREIVEMGRNPHRSRFRPDTPEDRAAVEEAMARTEVLEMAERRVDELSGGERQRVFLARALAQRTPVLLLDEPTANLDLLHAFQLLDQVSAEVARGGAALVALHDLNLAARHCHRILVLCAGRVEAVGPPAEVLTPELLQRVFGVEARIHSAGEAVMVEVLGPARA